VLICLTQHAPDSFHQTASLNQKLQKSISAGMEELQGEIVGWVGVEFSQFLSTFRNVPLDWHEPPS